MNATTLCAPPPALAGNVPRILGLGFFQTFLIVMPVIVPFFRGHGLDMQAIFLLQALFGLVVVVMEIPSGYLADRFGRRTTLVAGAVFAGLGQSCLPFADGFVGLALFEVLLGIGLSLISGADLALLYDTELALGRSETQQNRVVGRLYAMHTSSEGIAALVCALLVLVSMDAVVWAQAAIGWLPLLFAVGLVEPPGARLDRSVSQVGAFRAVLRHVLASDRLLRLTFIALCVWSLTTFYAAWLLQQYWQEGGIALVWFGVLWAAMQLVASESGRYADRIEARIGPEAVVALAGLLPAIGYLGMAWSGLAGGLLFAALFSVARGLGLVTLRNAFNRRVPSAIRATANSLASFGFRLSFVITGPLVGWMLDAWPMDTALLLLAAGSLAIYGWVILPLLGSIRALRGTP